MEALARCSATAAGSSGSPGSPAWPDGSSSSRVEVVLRVMHQLLGLDEFPAASFAPDFAMCYNGQPLDLAGFKDLWEQRKGLLRQGEYEVEQAFEGGGDRVGVVRRAHMAAMDDSISEVIAVDVWRLGASGLVKEAHQCWERVPGPAADDLHRTHQEGYNAEVVRAALAALQDVQGLQASLRRHWEPGFRGTFDGAELDFEGLCRHWAEVQASVSSLAVHVQRLVVHGSVVGVAHHTVCLNKGSSDDSAIGGKREVQVIALFTVAGSQVSSCQAVSRPVDTSNDGPRGTEALAVGALPGGTCQH